jgi:hypothetical protein
MRKRKSKYLGILQQWRLQHVSTGIERYWKVYFQGGCKRLQRDHYVVNEAKNSYVYQYTLWGWG